MTASQGAVLVRWHLWTRPPGSYCPHPRRAWYNHLRHGRNGNRGVLMVLWIDCRGCHGWNIAFGWLSRLSIITSKMIKVYKRYQNIVFIWLMLKPPEHDTEAFKRITRKKTYPTMQHLHTDDNKYSKCMQVLDRVRPCPETSGRSTWSEITPITIQKGNAIQSVTGWI